MLHGRELELARIEAFLAAAREGHGGALVVEGEPGVGKTAVLDAAREMAGDALVLRTAGLEAESSLPFSALGEVSGELLDGITALPGPQASAIEGALALAPASASDRFAVCAGFLGLLANAARRRPVLVIVDDAQWLDRASAVCFGYAARRLESRPIALLAAARGSQAHPFTGPRIDRMPLPGLDRGAARSILAELDPRLPRTVIESLVDAAAGNPLALTELPSLLTDDQRAGRTPLEHPLPPGMTVSSAFRARLERLGPQARRACAVVAAAFTPSLGPIQAACRTLDVDPASLEEAEADGIVRLTAERIDFDHPLWRGAAYEVATAAERRGIHRALAEHAEDDDARAWHLATAAVGPDPVAAEELERAAHRASQRGAHGAAADALERAARLSEDREARTRRLLAAGLAAAIGGAYDRGTALMELAEMIDDPATRASVRHRLALVTLNGGARSAYDTHRMLIDEAERVESVDPRQAASMYADAGVAAAVGGSCEMTLAAAERAATVLPGDAPAAIRAHVLSILGLGLALRGRTDEARDALDSVGALLGQIDPVAPAAQSIAFGLGARRCTGQDRVLRTEAEALAAAARESGAAGFFPYYQVLVADSAYRTGDWPAAQRSIADAIEGAEETGQLASLTIALVIAARIHASRGEEDEARAAVERALGISQGPGYGSPLGWGGATMGFLELSLDRTAEAISALERAAQLMELGGLEDPLIVPWGPDLVEAYARAGRLGEAAAAAERLAEQAKRNGTPLALALSARADGLASQGPFEDPFERALALHEQADAPFELARTLLAYGSRLHRARRRVDARDRLREALEAFERLGATPWAERARAELRAAGAVERGRVYDSDELTAQEVRVALAVAKGAKNREVAAELFLSPKTIEFHLGRVYRKLGIRSRTELAGIVAEGRLEIGAAGEQSDDSVPTEPRRGR